MKTPPVPIYDPSSGQIIGWDPQEPGGCFSGLFIVGFWIMVGVVILTCPTVSIVWLILAIMQGNRDSIMGAAVIAMFGFTAALGGVGLIAFVRVLFISRKR